MMPPCLSEHDACTYFKPCKAKRDYDQGSRDIAWLEARCELLIVRAEGWQEVGE